MIKELEQLQHNDLLTDLASAFEQYGCRTVLRNFKASYPQHFQEMSVQIHRLEFSKIPRLLQKESE